MADAKYVAYVSTYTRGDNLGIKIFDVDMEKGRFYPKNEVEITNSSYLTLSKNNKFLYSITDTGVEAYEILKNGDLKTLNHAGINGMRGSYLSTDYTDKFLFVGSYHDGKLTVLKLNEDGSIGRITDELYHRGMGSIADRSFRAHIVCTKMTRDNKYLLVADSGLDHTNVYRVDHRNGTVKQVDVIRSEPDSAPRHIKISKDGRFVYIVHEMKNFITVHSYKEEKGLPYFEKVQTISTLSNYTSGNAAASALNFSMDYKYLISSNAGDNSVVIYNRDEETGLLSRILCLPISGSYPKDAMLFPDNKHLVSLNHESNTMTFFNVDIEKGTLAMCAKEIPVGEPNCVIFYKLAE